MVDMRIFWCLVIMSLAFFCACLSNGHGIDDVDANENTGRIAVSSGKAMPAVAMNNKIIRGRKLALESEIRPSEKVRKLGSAPKTKKASTKTTSEKGEFDKEMSKLKSSPSAKEIIGRDSDEEGLVAFTADYWRARHHPPKNN